MGSPKINSFVALFFFIIISLTLDGCVTGVKKYGDSHGKIMVDRAEVFTRERLVPQRQKLKDILNEELSKERFDDVRRSDAVQGYQEVEMFKGLYLEVMAEYNKQKGEKDLAEHGKEMTTIEKDTAEQERQLMGIEQKQALLELQMADLKEAYEHQKEIDKINEEYKNKLVQLQNEYKILSLQKQIDALFEAKLKKPDSDWPYYDPNKEPDAQNLITKGELQNALTALTNTLEEKISNEMTNLPAKIKTELENKDTPDSTSPAEADINKRKLSNVFDTVKERTFETRDPNISKAQATPLEQLKNALAYWKAVQSEILEVDLDDVHDRNGMALYTLKFDITIQPERDFENFGKLALRIKKPHSLQVGMTCDEYGAAYFQENHSNLITRWKSAMNNKLNNEYQDFLKMYRAGSLGNEERWESLTFATVYDHETKNIYTTENVAKKATKLIDKYDEFKMKVLSEKNIVAFSANIVKACGGNSLGPLNITLSDVRDAMDRLDVALKSQQKRSIYNALVKARLLLDKAKSTIAKVAGGSLKDCEWKNRPYCKDQPKLDVKGEIQKLKKSIDNSYSEAFSRNDYIFKHDIDFSQTRTCLQNSQSDNDPDCVEGIANLVAERYRTTLFPYFNPEVIHSQNSDSGFDHGIVFMESSGPGETSYWRAACEEFNRTNKKAWNKSYVYSVEPKEYAQNISDMQAKERLTNIVGSLKAALPGSGLSLGAYTSYMDRSLTRLSAIKRKPLAVGYTNNAKEFGWLLGPKFEIEKGKVVWRHNEVTYSFQASIAAPGWLSSLDLCVNPMWLDKNNLEKDEWTQGCSHTLTLSLAGNMAAYADYLRSGRTIKRPSLLPLTDHGVYYVKAGRKNTSILIHGQNLWRTPEVYLGSQKANKVTITSNMKEILAEWTYGVDQPVIIDDFPYKLLDLTVITSEGKAKLKNAVAVVRGREIHDILKPEVVEPFAIMNIGKIQLKVDLSMAPDKYKQLHLAIRPKSADINRQTKWATITNPGKVIERTDKLAIVQFDLTSGDLDNDIWTPWGGALKSEVMECDLLRQDSPEDYIFTTMTASRPSFVLFKDKDESKGKLTPPPTFKYVKTITNDADGDEIKKQTKAKVEAHFSFELKNAPLLYEAYPGLQNALKDKRLNIQFFQEESGENKLKAELLVGKGRILKFTVIRNGDDITVNLDGIYNNVKGSTAFQSLDTWLDGLPDGDHTSQIAIKFPISQSPDISGALTVDVDIIDETPPAQ